MHFNRIIINYIPLLLFGCFIPACFFGQQTQVRGFVDVTSTYSNNKLSFGFGEQDLFVTSKISHRISFLGETVVKYTATTPSEFSVSVERVVLKYNFSGNHNLLIGKHHTPLNYWNDTYHHGRVFFPTIERPLLFSSNIIPLHTTGISFQGHDLGTLKFGYDLMIGNGLGAEDISDNDKNKSVTAAVHIKPFDKLRIGASWYYDDVAKGASVHGINKVLNWEVKQQLFSGSVGYFGKKYELLAEGTLAINHTDTTGSKQTLAGYLYGGYRFKDKWVPYIIIDNLDYKAGELYYVKNNTTGILTGIRYEINALAVVKLEYQHLRSELSGKTDNLMIQVAVGF
jgi:hypothetical protein